MICATSRSFSFMNVNSEGMFNIAMQKSLQSKFAEISAANAQSLQLLQRSADVFERFQHGRQQTQWTPKGYMIHMIHTSVVRAEMRIVTLLYPCTSILIWAL